MTETNTPKTVETKAQKPETVKPDPAPKTLSNENVAAVKAAVPDVKVVGDGDMFKVLCKASSQSEGWMKSTKALEMDAGCLVQVTTQQRNSDGSYAVAEALTFVPCVRIVPDVNGGNKLVKV
jgi:hypothetical protein